MNEARRYWYVAEHQSLAILIGCGLAVIFLVLRAFVSEFFLMYWGLGLFCFLFMILFFSVRVECDHEEVSIRYGIGLLNFRFPIFSIAAAGPVRNERLSAFPYKPKAANALEIVLRDGRKYTIPADSPKELAQALLARAHSR
ncbi:MAG: hypothetical protein KDD60_08500 [Bdellovibrionales bacterium]|nr:hypothetical protein [Bdellovibrionales bacterium]